MAVKEAGQKTQVGKGEGAGKKLRGPCLRDLVGQGVDEPSATMKAAGAPREGSGRRELCAVTQGKTMSQGKGSSRGHRVLGCCLGPRRQYRLWGGGALGVNPVEPWVPASL